MTEYVQKLSALLFYLLGGSFFLGYLLWVNGIGRPLTEWWLQVGDLPLIVVSMLYGGTSLYLSTKPEGKFSRGLTLGIAIPLIFLFLFLVLLNFWEVLGLPIDPN